MEQPSSPTPERLMQLAWGYALPLIIESAVETGVFDQLNVSPRTLEELSDLTGASERGLRAILNALVSVQLLQRRDDRYALTPESATFLVSNQPRYYGGLIRHICTQLLPRWLKLSEAVRTGAPVSKLNVASEGAPFFAEFVESIAPLGRPAAGKLGEHLEIAQATVPVSVLDIAAGSGVWGITLAQLSPFVRVRAVDWPQVLEVTTNLARRAGVQDRLQLAPGDLLEADFGSGHQIATLGQILHSEGELRSRQLLRKTFGAMAPGGTIAIMEFLPDDNRTGPPGALIFAVNMLVNTEAGDTYTFAELSAWLQEAGFTNPRLLKVPGPSPLVLATRP